MQKLTVIIATRNRCESLKDTLNSLLTQDYNDSFDYEVLVIDNNSNDKTREVVESYFPLFNGKLRYLFESKQGKSYALNTGIKESAGDILVFTDDDVIADKKWLLNLTLCFKEYNCDAVGGRVLPLYRQKTPGWIKKNIDLLDGPIPAHDYGERSKPYAIETMVPFIGANMAITKDCFIKNGLFDTGLGPGTPRMGDDTELFKRLKNKAIYYCGESFVWHKIDENRTNLKYIAGWFIKSGRCGVPRKYQQRKDLVYYFRIPRYLFKETAKYFLFLIINIFNKREFLKLFRKIFMNIGAALEFRDQLGKLSK